MVTQGKKEKIKMGWGLRELPPDSRDFSFGKAFGVIDLKDIPANFVVAEPIKIEDQKETDFCTGYASSSVSEDQEGVDLDPLYAFAKIKQVQGSPEKWGANLRDTCKAAVKFGFIEKTDSPFTLEKGRDFLADYRNWPEALDEKAKVHRKKSYFKIDGYKEIFDALRAALWMNRDKKKSILTGVGWRDRWNGAEGGIIPDYLTDPIAGHALKIFGQKDIGGELYLIAQLSNGRDVGDFGIFYFSRKVINRDFTYGAYIFEDMSPEEAKKICWSALRKILEAIKETIHYIITKCLNRY